MRGSFEETARRGLDEGRARAKNEPDRQQGEQIRIGQAKQEANSQNHAAYKHEWAVG
jgi:hypothetical protein